MYTKDIISWLATVCTVALFCTGIPICMKIYRKGNTADTSLFPLVAMFCNASLWCKYGLLKGDQVIILVNFIGAVLSLCYISIYYMFSMQKGFVHRQFMFGSALLFPMLLYIRQFASDLDTALYRLGVYCASNAVINYGAPLTAIKEVIRTRSTECMAFPLCFANFIVALEWLTYGYMVEDLFIQVPNTIGACLGLLQLSLFVKFPQKKLAAGPTTAEQDSAVS